jgi:rhodanese-related sulfurtransferase
MASWNNNFSQIWFSGIDNAANESYFVNDVPTQPAFNNLPVIDLPTSNNSLKERIKDRISILLKESFDENTSETNSNELAVKFNPISHDSNNYFIVCYGPIELYYTSTINEMSVPGHIPGSYLFRSTPPFFDLRSTRLLQILPPDKPILIYSLDGQLSAYIAAYLRLLGYDVKSILFGAHSLFYDALIKIPGFTVFTSAEVNNYSYE